jgi:hypothetical protein
MAHFHFQYSDGPDRESSSISFNADDIFAVLEKFRVFLNTADFFEVNEVIAVSHDPEGGDEGDLYYFSDGHAATGAEIDAENNEQPEEGNAQ